MIHDITSLPFEKALMDGIQEMVFIVRVEKERFVYEFINQAVIRKTKMDKSVIGKSFHEIQSRTLGKFLHTQHTKVLDSGKQVIYEDSYLDSNDKLKFSKARLTPMFNDKGRCTHIMCIVQDVTNEVEAKLESLKALEGLEESRAYYHSLFEHNADAILTVDLAGHIKGANPVGLMFSQLSMEDLRDRQALYFIVPEDRQKTFKNFQKAKKGVFKNFRVTIRQKNNVRLGALVKFIPIKIKEATTGFYVIIRDMRELDLMVELYIESEKNFRVIAENANDVIILINHHMEYLYISPSLEEVYGYTREEYKAKEPLHNIHPDELEELQTTFSKSVAKGITCKMRVRIHHKNGDWIWSELHGTPVYDDAGVYSHMVSIVRDISLQKDYETKLEFYAYHDPLTGLPNRRFFQESLEKALKNYQSGGDSFAVLLLDIDKFKEINDVWGHEAGDAVIREFSDRLKAVICRDNLAARLGGDEFVILLPGVDSLKSGSVVMEKIRRSMMHPWELGDMTLSVSSSIGMTLPRKDSTPSSILREADKAMYKEKNLKKQFLAEDRL